jgi:hypothetical protein
MLERSEAESRAETARLRDKAAVAEEVGAYALRCEALEKQLSSLAGARAENTVLRERLQNSEQQCLEARLL